MVNHTPTGRRLEWFVFWLTLLASALAPLLPRQRPPPESIPFPGWPATWEGRPLHPLPLSDRERAFATGFPGRVGRFSDGRREIILRWITAPTRKLHPGADCLRAIDYRITPRPMGMTGDGRRQNCLSAERHGERLRVCEWIRDGSGRSWSTVSAWYWHALFNPESAPWWAFAVAETESSNASGENSRD